MAWVNPTPGLLTGSLISDVIWNQDIRDNTRFLKGLDGVIDLENSVTPDVDDTHDLGSLALRWQEIFASKAVFQTGFRVAGRREERITWEDTNHNEYQWIIVQGVGGSILPGGSGQMVLKGDRTATGGPRVVQQTATNSSGDNNWSPSKSIYYRIEMHMDVEGTSVQNFIGLRATPGNSIPAASEDYVGFIKTGTPDIWNASNSNGSTKTDTDIDTHITVANRHVLELYIDGVVDIQFWVDGVLRATHTTNLPNTDLQWTVVMLTDASGAGDVHLTLGQQIIQEDTP